MILDELGATNEILSTDERLAVGVPGTWGQEGRVVRGSGADPCSTLGV